MKNFEYTITDDKMGAKAAEATKLMALMGMGVKKGDTVTVEVEGDDEDTAVNDMKVFFENNF